MKRALAGLTTAALALTLAVVGVSATASADTTTPATATSSSYPTVDEGSYPTGDTPAPSAPTCVSSPTFSYTFDSATASGVISVTKSGATAGTPLCSPLAVRAATWTYDLPTNGQSPSWSQTLESTNDYTVGAIGSVSYSAPNATAGCRQHDIYASFYGVGALTLPSTLTAPGKPFEPTMLSSALAGTGPSPTYSFDSSADCATTPATPPVTPPVTPPGTPEIAPVSTVTVGTCHIDSYTGLPYKNVSLVFDNTASTVPVVFTVENNGTVDNSGYSREVPAGSTVIVPVRTSTTTGVTYVVTANGVSTTLTVPAFTSCDSEIGGDSLAVPTFADVCGTAGDTVTIPTLTSDDHYTFTVTDARSNGVGTVTVTAVPASGYVFAPDVTTSWTQVFQSDTDLDCLGDVTTITPTVTPQTCDEDSLTGVIPGSISIPVTTGINYTIHPVSPAGADIAVVSATTQVAVGTYTVTAVAAPGYTLSGATTFAVTVADDSTDCQLPTHAFLPATVAAVGQTCTEAGGMTSGFVDVDLSGGLTYFLGTRQLTAARTLLAPGNYVVQAVALAGDSIDGQSVFPVTIAAVAVSCSELATLALGDSALSNSAVSDSSLAFTGFDGGAIYLSMAALLLLIGATLVVVTRIRRRA